MVDVVSARAAPRLPVKGGGSFPVRRIYCVGRNYADHVREMGGDPKTQPPVFFTKPADAVVASGAEIPYPPATDDLHYEAELVLALCSDGARVSAEGAEDLIFGYAVGCDLTRRDRQKEAKDAGAPWDVAKAFDNSAPVGPVVRKGEADLQDARIRLSVNGAPRQDAALASMIWTPAEIIAALSERFALAAGDLVFTGTPEGVGPLVAGDAVRAEIDGLEALTFSIAQ
ncbi:MAG: fumarylacetoacetate hydrolase family protein [Pseudomonadota bacterium]